jgi:hypothetical protein
LKCFNGHPFWKHTGSKVEAKDTYDILIAFMYKENVPTEGVSYKRDPVSMKDQDSLWIINPLN